MLSGKEDPILSGNIISRGRHEASGATGNKSALAIVINSLSLPIISDRDAVTKTRVNAVSNRPRKLNIIAGASKEGITFVMETLLSKGGLTSNRARVGDKLDIIIIRHDRGIDPDLWYNRKPRSGRSIIKSSPGFRSDGVPLRPMT